MKLSDQLREEPQDGDRLGWFGAGFAVAGFTVALIGIGIAATFVLIVWLYARTMNGF